MVWDRGRSESEAYERQDLVNDIHPPTQKYVILNDVKNLVLHRAHPPRAGKGPFYPTQPRSGAVVCRLEATEIIMKDEIHRFVQNDTLLGVVHADERTIPQSEILSPQ